MDPRHEDAGIPLEVLAERSGAQLVGDGAVLIRGVAALDDAGPGAIAFLANPTYRRHLATTGASAVILLPHDAGATGLPKLVSANPYATYARVATLLHPAPPVTPRIDASAVVAPTARVAESAAIAAYVVVGERTTIGARVRIHAG